MAQLRTVVAVPMKLQLVLDEGMPMDPRFFLQARS
jgi:hypothetical protein